MPDRATFEILSGRDGLEILRPDWTALQRDCAGAAFYTDWRWHWAVARHLAPEPLHYVCLRRADRLIGILPLQARILSHGILSIPALAFPTHDHIELSDMLVPREEATPGVFEALLSFLDREMGIPWHCLHLRGLAEGAGLLATASGCRARIDHQRGNAFFKTRDGSPLPVPAKLLRNISRLRNRAEKEFGAVSTTSSRNGEGLTAAFEAFLDIEASGWKGEGGAGTAIRHTPALVSFYRDLLDGFAADGSIAINLLWFHDRPAAGQFCIKAGGTWSILKIGYEDAFRSFGPGSILLQWFIEECTTDATTGEVNLVTAPDWARRWHALTRKVYTITGYRETFQGRALKVAHAVYRNIMNPG